MSNFDSIQFLRAVAASLVVAQHSSSLTNTFFDGGIGVDIFFVISGLVMVISTRQGARPTDFLWKRLTRIVPLYWLTTAAAVAFLYFMFDSYVPLPHALSSFLFLPPIGSNVPVLYVGWSLNFEMFFYLVLACSLFVRGGFFIAACLLAAVGAVSTKTGTYWIDYYLNQRLLEFAAGMAIGTAFLKGAKVDRSVALAVVAISIGLWVINYQWTMPLAWAVPAVLLVVATTSLEGVLLFKLKPARLLGDASYAIYLTHPFVVWTLQVVMGNEKSGALAVGAFFISLVLGIAVHLLIEKPMLNFTRSASIAPRMTAGETEDSKLESTR